jgi:hypothetical protein
MAAFWRGHGRRHLPKFDNSEKLIELHHVSIAKETPQQWMTRRRGSDQASSGDDHATLFRLDTPA